MYLVHKHAVLEAFLLHKHLVVVVVVVVVYRRGHYKHLVHRLRHDEGTIGAKAAVTHLFVPRAAATHTAVTATVHKHVSLQLGVTVEGLVALVTLIVLLAAVHQHVPLQFGVAGEALVTDVTLVVTLASVHQHVAFQL